MDALRALLLRLRALVWRSRVERELDEELRFHLDLEAESGVRRGLSPAAARRAALLRFGGVERHREAARDERGVRWLEDAVRDVRHAVRGLRRQPGFAAAAVLTLALGIGANTAIYSVVDAVLLSPSPFPAPDRLVVAWQTDRGSDTHHEPWSWPDVEDVRSRSRTLESVGVLVGQDLTLTGAGDPERLTGLAVTPELPGVLGVRPLVGRPFVADDGDWSSGLAVLLGEGFWRRRYGGDPGVVGRTLVLDGRPAMVVGVLPAEADLGLRQVHERADYAPSFSGHAVDVWVAFQPTAAQYPRETHPFLMLARLAPGAGLAAAQSELASIAADLEAQYAANANRGVNLESFADVVFGPIRPALLVLLLAVALVLLVTCVNVANLLLARGTARTRDVAVRRALGAGAARLRRQHLTEAAVLTVLGAGAGIVLAYAGVAALVALAPADIPRLDGAGVSGRVLAFTAGVAVLVTAAFGLVPSLQARRLDVHGALKAQPGRRVSEGRAARRLRSGLVVAEVALAVMLVVGAALLLRSVWTLQRVDPGFETERVLKAQYQLPATRYPLDFSRWPDLPEITGFHARLLDAVRSAPGVEAAAIAGGHPLDAGFTNSFVIEGREAESADLPEIRIRFVTPGYLEALGVALLDGRPIREGDDVRATPVIVINAAAAARYFPGGALGQRVRFWGIAREIVGVIGDERFRGLDRPSEPAVYAPLAQNPQQVAALLVRAAAGVDPMALVPEIRRRFHALDAELALYAIEPLAATVTRSISRPRFTAGLLALFAAVAILLALVGVHGVLSYAVARRAPELGVRMALGASRRRVVAGVLAEGLALAGAGLALGLLGAAAGARVLASLLYGVTTTDLVAFGGVAGAVLATAAAASLAPALRASRVDPMATLRAD